MTDGRLGYAILRSPSLALGGSIYAKIQDLCGSVNMKASELVPIEANENIPDFGPGDTVRVNFRIREGNRERVQAFQGVCIRRTHGKGPAANFTVRRITAGIGIERVFPLHSPLIESLEVTRQGKVRRARLYYLRGRQGRAARIKERTTYRNR